MINLREGFDKASDADEHGLLPDMPRLSQIILRQTIISFYIATAYVLASFDSRWGDQLMSRSMFLKLPLGAQT
jgi:hypothetical protein